MLNKQIHNKMAYSSIVLIFAVLLGLMWRRLFYSVPHIDEAFFIAEPYQIIMGNKPFAEIWTVSQGASTLLAPIIWLYRSITGGMEGIILFTRQAYFFSKIAIAFVSIMVLKKKTGLLCACLAVAPTIFLVPYSFSNLGYNTTSLDLVFLSSILIFSSSSYSKSNVVLLIAGFVCAVAAIFYPPLIILAIFNVAFIFLIYRKQHGGKSAIHSCKYYCIGGVLTAFIFTSMFIALAGGVNGIFTGINGILRSPYNDMKYFDGLFDLLNTVFLQFIHKHYVFVIITILVVAAISFSLFLLRKKIKTISNSFLLFGLYGFIAIALCFFLIIPIRPGSYYYVFYMLIAFAGTISAFFIDNIDSKATYLWGMIAPAWVVLIVRNISSANFNIFSQFVAVMPFIVCIQYFFYIKVFNSETMKRAHRLLLPVMSITISAVCLFAFYQFINSHTLEIHPISYYNTRIESGPYKGIYSDYSMERDINSLYDDISNHSQDGKSILVLDGFPAAYLMTSMRPCTPNTWSLFYSSKSDDYAQLYFESTGRLPDILFIINSERTHYPIHDEEHKFNQYIKQNYQKVYENYTETFELYIFARE